MTRLDAGNETGVTANGTHPPVRVTHGAEAAILTEPARESLPTVERAMRYECASAGRRSGRWRGIPLGDLLAWAPIRPDATHLLVESRDGHAACVAVQNAINGLLALEVVEPPGTDDATGPSAGPADGWPRLIAPGIAAAKTVKAVRRIEAFRCGPDQDPRALAGLGPPPAD